MKEQKREQKKGNKYIAPILCGLAVVLVAAIYVFVILWAALVEPIPLPFLLFLFLIPAAILFRRGLRHAGAAQGDQRRRRR